MEPDLLFSPGGDTTLLAPVVSRPATPPFPDPPDRDLDLAPRPATRVLVQSWVMDDQPQSEAPDQAWHGSDDGDDEADKLMAAFIRQGMDEPDFMESKSRRRRTSSLSRHVPPPSCETEGEEEEGVTTTPIAEDAAPVAIARQPRFSLLVALAAVAILAGSQTPFISQLVLNVPELLAAWRESALIQLTAALVVVLAGERIFSLILLSPAAR